MDDAIFLAVWSVALSDVKGYVSTSAKFERRQSNPQGGGSSMPKTDIASFCTVHAPKRFLDSIVI